MSGKGPTNSCTLTLRVFEPLDFSCHFRGHPMSNQIYSRSAHLQEIARQIDGQLRELQDLRNRVRIAEMNAISGRLSITAQRKKRTYDERPCSRDSE